MRAYRKDAYQWWQVNEATFDNYQNPHGDADLTHVLINGFAVPSPSRRRRA